LPVLAKPALHPRKTPVQTRSAVTVDAILDAAIQVLVAVGKERLTTTLVAQRAGVSVGTLYQYFPNKSALLQASLRRHMDEVGRAVREVCETFASTGLLTMTTALIDAFFAAKLRSVRASVALYAVSSDIEGAAISKAVGTRSLHAAAALFATAKEGLSKDPEIVASVVLSALHGIARRVLEARSPEQELKPLRTELLVMVEAYLSTCTMAPLAR
jgi:AcrR family transcriptional regulator